MIKVSHESPRALYEMSNEFNDYDYALTPAVLDDKEYRSFFKKQSDNGREVWLDSGIFEEGVARSDDEMIKAAKMINASLIICPDVLHDGPATLKGAKRFINRLKKDKLNYKIMVVAQGKTEEEFIECFTELSKLDVEKVAIPYDLKFYDEFLNTNTQKRFVLARQLIIDRLLVLGLVKHKIHLLGSSDPLEFIRYGNDRDTYKLVDSVDTSAPVLHGMFEIKLTDTGLPGEKRKDLLIDNINTEVTDKQLEIIKYNLKKFKQYLGR